MEDPFKIEVLYENDIYEFEARIPWMGYQHKIEVIVIIFLCCLNRMKSGIIEQ